MYYLVCISINHIKPSLHIIVMADYTKGKIYRLVCNTTGNQYIGSTTQSLSQRLGGHHANYKQFLEGKITKQISSFSILSENNFEMILIEEFPCENKNQLERRERHFIETMKCVNKLKPAPTKEELLMCYQNHYQENKEKILKYQQKHYQENKEKIQERKQKYRYDNKEKLKEYTHKYGQEYYNENKVKIKEKASALTICECGGQYQHMYRTKHFKTFKHMTWVVTHETTQ